MATPISAEEINTEEKDAWRKIWIEELGGRPEEIEGVPIEEIRQMMLDKDVYGLYQPTFNEELGASADLAQAEGSTCTETPDRRSIEDILEEGIDWAGANAKNLYPEKGSPLYNQVVGYLCAGISLDNKTIQVEEVKQSYIEGDEGNSNFCLEEAQDSPGAQGQCHLTCKNSEGEWVSGDACEREGSSRHQYSFVVVHPPATETSVGLINRGCYEKIVDGKSPAQRCSLAHEALVTAGIISAYGTDGSCEKSKFENSHRWCLNYEDERKVENPFTLGTGNSCLNTLSACVQNMKACYEVDVLKERFGDKYLEENTLCTSRVFKSIERAPGPGGNFIDSTKYCMNDEGLIGLSDAEFEDNKGRGTGYECGTVTYTYGSELAQDKTESLIECQIKRELYLSESDTRDTRPQCGVECREGSAPGCEPPRTNDQAQICFNANRLRRDTNPSAVLANDRALRDRKRERARSAAEEARERTWADIYKPGQLVPCYGVGNPDKEAKNGIRAHCDWNALIQLANNIISFAIRLAAFVLVLVILIAGWGLITSRGNPQALTDARAKLFKAILGFAIVVCAWLIVNTVMNTLLDEKFQNDDIINLLEDGTP